MSKLITPEFRVAFPSVFRAKRNDLSGKDEFSVVALFKKDADLSALKDAAREVLAKKFGEDNLKWPKNLRNPFRDQGDRAKVNDEGVETLPSGYEKGATYLNLRSQQRPGVVASDMQEIIDEADFYGGCWARATLTAFAYDKAGNRGVSFGLGNLQKLRDGDHFGNRTRPEQDFTAVADATGTAEQSSDDLFK